MPRNPCPYGARKVGSIMKTRVAGSNGTAATTSADAAQTTSVRYAAGVRSSGTSLRSKITARRMLWTVVLASGRHYFIGRTIRERSDRILRDLLPGSVDREHLIHPRVLAGSELVNA